MIDAVLNDRKLTASNLERNIQINHNNVSVKTIGRMLTAEGLIARKPHSIHEISEENKIKRLKWCKSRRHWKQ